LVAPALTLPVVGLVETAFDRRTAVMSEERTRFAVRSLEENWTSNQHVGSKMHSVE